MIVQVHTQKNVLKLSSQRMAAVNGSHVGLIELLTAGESRLQNYHIICYPHDNNKDNVAVLIAAQLLANEGNVCVRVCVSVFVCLCVC